MRCLDDGWVRVRPHVVEGEGRGVIGGCGVQGLLSVFRVQLEPAAAPGALVEIPSVRPSPVS